MLVFGGSLGARSLNDAYGDGDDADARRTAALSPLIALLSGTRAIECAMRWVWVDLALASAAEAVESYGGDASALTGARAARPRSRIRRRTPRCACAA